MTSFLENSKSGVDDRGHRLRFIHALLRRRSLVEPGPIERSERARFAGCLPFFRVGQGGVLEKQEAAAEEAAQNMIF